MHEIRNNKITTHSPDGSAWGYFNPMGPLSTILTRWRQNLMIIIILNFKLTAASARPGARQRFLLNAIAFIFNATELCKTPRAFDWGACETIQGVVRMGVCTRVRYQRSEKLGWGLWVGGVGTKYAIFFCGCHMNSLTKEWKRQRIEYLTLTLRCWSYNFY